MNPSELGSDAGVAVSFLERRLLCRTPAADGSATFQYDANSNRIYALNSAGLIDGTQILHDDQDRLVEYGDFQFVYTPNGELASKENVVTGAVWEFDYDVRQSLLYARLPDGDEIAYVVDARGRRRGKKINGVLVQGFLYGGALDPVAELDGAGNVMARFVYGVRRHVPDYVVKAGATYRLISDHLGSVVAVVDTSTGALVQRLEYDAWGRVLADTNPGFQPFGFAGGIYDLDTRLVRFGARDYDPGLGRWTAKDPALLRGRDLNFYGYALSDPVNHIDQTGKWPDEPFDNLEDLLEDFRDNYVDFGNPEEMCSLVYYEEGDDGVGVYWYDEPNLGWTEPDGTQRCAPPDPTPLDPVASCHSHTPADDSFPTWEFDIPHCSAYPEGCYIFGFSPPPDSDPVCWYLGPDGKANPCDEE